MLIRCDAHDHFDVREIHRCLQIGAFLERNGHRMGWAVPKSGFDRFKRLLPEGAQLFRLPLTEDDELERLAHLHRKHGFQSILINREQATSSFLFNLNRQFKQTILMSRQYKGMIYGDMLIDPDPMAVNRKIDCATSTRLLLGHKFFMCDPKPLQAPCLDIVSHILLDVGDAIEPGRRILTVMSGMTDLPVIHVLCGAKAPIAVAMVGLKEQFPHLDVHPVLRPVGELFPFERYPLVITRAGRHCLDLAREGRFMLTLAVEKQEVEMAYTLSQKEVAPTLGWLAAKEDEDLADAIRHCLGSPDIRHGHSKAAMSYVDGQGLIRIAHLIHKD